MFDLITGAAQHIPSRPAVPVLVSLTAQVSLVTAAMAVSALWVADSLPQIPTMMAFVAAPPAPPPPPPPPAPALKRAPAARPEVPTTGEWQAPLEPPPQIEPGAGGEGFDEGAIGGVEGGVPGGIVGGVIGGLPDAPPPPPPPPPPVARGPVRVGGQITTPALLHRVEPVYPPVAVAANLQGVAILETVVDEDGLVTDVRVLRSAGSVLDREAIAAVRQWRYSPLVLNGIRVKFLLTVTLSFRLEQPKGY